MPGRSGPSNPQRGGSALLRPCGVLYRLIRLALPAAKAKVEGRRSSLEVALRCRSAEARVWSPTASRVPRLHPPFGATSFSYQPSADLGGASAPLGGAHELTGLPDGAGLVLMDPAEVPDQSESRRRAARDHQPAFRPGRERCLENVDTLRSIRNLVVLVSTAAADRARVTPCPSQISCPEA